jgi:hypothetical protein
MQVHSIAWLLAFSVASLLAPASAGAQERATEVNSKPQKPASVTPNANSTANGCKMAKNPGKRHFIEFRARTAQSYGHAFVVFGTLNARGKIAQSEIAGLHPVGDSVVYSIGHFVMVPSETGASEGDSDEQYVSARYCVMLSEPEYKTVVAYIRQLQKNSTVWHAALRNCVTFITDIAQFMGLQLPASHWLYPEVWVKNLDEINSGPQHTAVTRVPYAQWGIEPGEEPSSSR